MSIFLKKDSTVIIQGITGSEGTKHTKLMLNYGTKIVGGVSIRKVKKVTYYSNDYNHCTQLPVFTSVSEAVQNIKVDISVIFVPPNLAKYAIMEAIDSYIPLVVVITEGIPVQDTIYSLSYNCMKGNKTKIIGPNCPGIMIPESLLVGIIPRTISNKGPIGLVSKSGTLTYQMMNELHKFGFSTVVGVGGDPILGTTPIEVLEMLEKDSETKIILMIGEIGGDAEERAAEYISNSITKPVVGYIAGFTAPEGKTMGHAGAIISNSCGTAQIKKEVMESMNIKVGNTPSETVDHIKLILQNS